MPGSDQTTENTPIPMLLVCPCCGARHIDEGDFATKVHHTHACQNCGMCWRPAVVPTVGVRFLPGFKNPDPIDAATAAINAEVAKLESLVDKVGVR